MSRIAPPPETERSADDELLRQLGYDPLAIPDMTEAEAFEFIRGINNHITPRNVRRAIARRELRGVLKGRKFLFSKREAVRWMQTSDGQTVGGAA
jgi:hypothetical protein